MKSRELLNCSRESEVGGASGQSTASRKGPGSHWRTPGGGVSGEGAPDEEGLEIPSWVGTEENSVWKTTKLPERLWGCPGLEA